MATTKNPATVKTQTVATAEALDSQLVVDLIASGTWRNKKFVTAPVDPEQAARRIAQRDIAANSLDELLGTSDTISGRDYVNRPFTLLSVEWQPSEIDGDGLPFYAVLHGVNLDGEAITITTGAITVVRKVAIMDCRAWFPAAVKITKGPKTDAGYEPLDLVKAPEIQAF